MLDLRAIDDVLARSNGRRGVAPLRSALADQPERPAVRSELERRFLQLCRDAGLPSPATNVLVEGFLVDAVWPKPRLVVELDGYEFHRSRDAFERDRRRDAVLALAGYRVVRVTYRMLAREPARVAGTILSLLTRDA